MKLNNKGFFLNITVIVIIVVSFIVTGCLAIVMANWNMKKTEREIQKNYYSTEMALDEIKAGVEEGCSEDIEHAYSILISSLNTVPYDSLNEEFKKIYADGLKKRYESDLKDTLTGYLSNPEGNKMSIVSEPTFDDSLLDNNKIYLRNIGVSHVSENDVYLSRIFTDIEITIPQLYDGVEVSSMSATDFTEFSLIADVKLQINGTTKVTGGVYAGNNGIVLGESGMPDCNFISNKVITRGDIELHRGSYLTLKGMNDGNAEVYADDFIISRKDTHDDYADNSLAAELTANMYLTGDTLLNAKNGGFKLSGNYYGYTKDNSAFCINGTGVDADLQGVNTLWIAGTSYIDFSNVSADILMGESLTYKGTQMMYLMPSICIRNIAGDSVPNPVTSEYIIDGELDTSKFIIDLTENQKNGGVDLTKYVNKEAPYRAVAVKPPSGVGDKIYLYLNFTDSLMASKYSKSYISYYEENVNAKANAFGLGGILLGENTSLRTVGNVISYNDNKVTVRTSALSNNSNDYVSYKQSYFSNRYNSLVSTLQEHKTSVKNDSLFDYLINRDEIDGKDSFDFDSAICSDGIFTCDKAVYYNNTDGYTILVTGSDVGIQRDFKGLVITTGNANITSGVNICGTIISGGTINTGNNNVTISASDSSGESPLLYLLYDWSGRDNVTKYFSGFKSSPGLDVDNFTIKSTIKYRNWVKE